MQEPYRRLPIALAALGLLGAAPATPLPAQAMHAFAWHDYARARVIWLGLARGGDAEAAFQLGLLAELGEGEPGDAAKAYRWYWQAAQSGYAEAEFNVAVMKDSGRGTTHDPAGAAAWYARAAAHGNRRAQYNLALLYRSGDGVPRNPAVARAWFKQAATNGLPAAAAKLDAIASTPCCARLSQSTTLNAAIPVAPLATPAVTRDPDGMAEFVWTAPAQPVAAEFFLDVVARDKSGPRELHASYTGLTAALVHLGDGVGSYAWRVFTVSPTSRSYMVTAWTPFRTAGAR